MPFGIVDFIRNRLSNQVGGSPPPVAPPPTARPTPGIRMPGINLGGPVSAILGGNIGRGGVANMAGNEAMRGGGGIEPARPRRNRRGRRRGGVRGNRGRRGNNTQERYMSAAPEPNVNYQNGMRRMRNRLSMF